MGKTYTVREVAEILGFSTNSIYAFLKEGRIKGVRVGRGRFRVPEEELARVLHLSKKPVVAAEETPAVQPAPTSLVPRRPTTIARVPSAMTFMLGKRWTEPTMFDWLTGLAAIVSGVGLFLFNRTVQPDAGARFELVMPFVRWILIATGLGLLTSSAVTTEKNWRRFFYSTLCIMGSFNALVLLRSGDVSGGLMYGSMALLSGVGAWISSMDTYGLPAYITLLAVSVPVAVLAGTHDYQITTLLSHFDMSRTIATALVASASALFLTLYWKGYPKNTWYYWIASAAVGLISVLGALYDAQINYWSRAFFLLVFGFLAAFHPIYRTIGESGTPRVKWLTQGLFAFVGILLILASISVGLLQAVSWDQQYGEYINKTSAGALLVDRSVSSVKSTLLTAAKNPEILDAISASDSAQLETLSKVMYEGNENLRRLVFLNKEGNGIALYPHGVFDQANLSFRDYFRRVRETRQPYISELYTALADNVQRKVVSVSVPLISRDGEFLGVLSGSVDLLRIGAALQSMAVGVRRERYIVADGEGKLVISPDPLEVGTLLPSEDPTRKAFDGTAGADMSRMLDGTLALVTYAPVPNSTWVVSLRVPASRVYSLNQMAVLTIFGVICVVLILSLLWLHLLQVRTRTLPEGLGP